MASIVDLIKHLQSTIEKYPKEEHKVLKCFDKLYSLGVTVEHLQETGVGRTVNALRKEPGDVGAAARALVNKWKLMVAAEENSEPEDYNHDTSHYNGNGNGKDSDDSLNQSRNGGSRHTQSHSSSRSKSNEHRHTNGDSGSGKRKYPSSEEEPDTKKSRHHHQSNENKVKVKTEPKTESESDGSESEYSDSSESEVEVKKEKTSSPEVKKEKTSSPDTYRSSSSKHSHSTHEIKQEKDIKKEKESSSKRSHDSPEHSKHKESRHSEDKSSKDRSSSSHKHKSNKDKESSTDEKHKSNHKSSNPEKSSSSKHSSSDKHKSSHKSSSEDKHSSSKKSDKPDKHASQSLKEKHKSSSDKDKRDKSSSKDKHSENESKHKNSSKDKSSHSHKSEKHSSSESKSKDRTKSDKEKSGESGSEREYRKSSTHKSSKKSKEEPKNVSQTASEDSDDGIGCESGASFAEALGMRSPAKAVKKKTSTKDMTSPCNSFMQDLGAASLLAPTAKLTPLPPLEISALPEISPNYKPRPPPKLLPHFTDEDAISAGISSKNQRTKVYSGNKMFGKIPSLYELCVHVLQEHIDALEFTGGVPYDILKPVVDRATPQQLFMLEHFNPYLMEDTDHLWKKFCEKHFRSMKRQEMETWREMYIRCQEEQEHKLKSLTANIKMTQEAKKAPIKQTKMAYVDSVVKPPRNIARKQAIHGTARTAAASPAARVAALASSGVVRAGTVRPPPAPAVSLANFNKPKKAPLMAKALQFMRGRKR